MCSDDYRKVREGLFALPSACGVVGGVWAGKDGVQCVRSCIPAFVRVCVCV